MTGNVTIDLGTSAQEDIQIKTSESSELAKKVDRYSELLSWAASNKADPRTKELEALKKEFQEIANSMADDTDEITLQGEKTFMVAGARAVRRKVSDMEGIFKLLPASDFLKICNVTLGKLDDYLTKSQRDKVLTEEFGARIFKSYEKTDG